ncbi:hypothetical protein DFH09DRAFT_629091 [Mycena vulgaris]|nr:hypothetical protein DFH09DRAFT_629091 [Mycena vulgaris]
MPAARAGATCSPLARGGLAGCLQLMRAKRRSKVERIRRRHWQKGSDWRDPTWTLDAERGADCADPGKWSHERELKRQVKCHPPAGHPATHPPTPAHRSSAAPEERMPAAQAGETCSPPCLRRLPTARRELAGEYACGARLLAARRELASSSPLARSPHRRPHPPSPAPEERMPAARAGATCSPLARGGLAGCLQLMRAKRRSKGERKRRRRSG